MSRFAGLCGNEIATPFWNGLRMTPQTKGHLIGALFVAAIAAIGIYILLAGLGQFGRGRGDAPGWVLIAAGAAFLLAAASTGLNTIGGLLFGAKADRHGKLSDDAPYARTHPTKTPGRCDLPLMVAQAAAALFCGWFAFQFQGSRSAILLAG